ncbi:MAG: hypothetical protein HZB23_05610 [Deltaproteobacteria bacterium]|nr:hypothetical protein [Deltaproteobacteria bacterium]
MRFFSLFILALLLAIQPSAVAQAKDRAFSREVTPLRTGVFSPKDEEVVALARARRAVLSEVGSWLSAFAGVKTAYTDPEGLAALAAALVKVHAKGQGNAPGSGVNRITLSASISDGEVKKSLPLLLADPVLVSRYARVGKREGFFLGKAQDLEKRLASLSPGEDRAAEKELVEGYGGLAAKLAAVSLMYMAHDEYLKEGKGADLGKAMKYYEGAARLDEGYADAWACQALVHLSQTRYTDAVDDFTKAISLSPKDPDLFQDRGVTFGQCGRPDLAVKDFTRAIALKPDFTRAYAARAYAYMILDKVDAACKDLHKACDLGECMFLKGARALGKCK